MRRAASWNTAFTATTIYNLAPGNSTDPAQNWKLTAVSVTKPFQMPTLSAAGCERRSRAPDGP